MSRPSRMLFRENEHDEDLMSSDPFSVNLTVTQPSEDDYEHPITPDESETDLVEMGESHSDEHNLPPKRSWSDECHQPDSPLFGLLSANHSKCSSPTNLGSGVRQLNLFGSPRTPKTILKRSRLSDKSLQKSPVHKSLFGSRGQKRPRNVVNINPFTPNGMLIKQANKRRKSSPLDGSFITTDTPIESNMMSVFNETDEDSDDDKQEVDISLEISENDNPDSRFGNDFHAVSEIGSGEFGKVYKCINKLDGCIYAVKKTKKPMRGSQTEKKALNEVYAHAVLGKHHRIVRYYSAWAEKEHMYIQNEYCDGGSLADVMEEMKSRNEKLTEHQLKKIIKHIAQGLKFIHSQKLSHMDIKPENIFISNSAADSLNSSLNRTLDSSDDGFDEDDDSDIENINELTYKIGDLGLVTTQENTCVEEGDCRYLPLEILKDKFEHLDKADIFALGLTIYEAASLETLPKNGITWSGIRSGEISLVTNYSTEFNSLVKRLIDVDDEKIYIFTFLTYFIRQ